MKRSPLSLSLPGAIACAALIAGALAASGSAGASTRAPQVTPVTSCPSTSSVSAAAGFSVPAPTTTSYTNTGTSARFGKITTTGTICEYGAPSIGDLHYAILLFAKLSKSIPTGQVQSYVQLQMNRVNQKMPPGSKFTWKLGTLAGVTAVFMSGGETISTFHLNFSATIGYRNGKVAGAEGLNLSQSKVNALAKVAFNKLGI